MNDSEKTVERLNQLLDERDAEIEELKASVARLEREVDGSLWGWTLTRGAENDLEGLPVPRLEIVCHKLVREDGSWTGDTQYDYRLVYRHLDGTLLMKPFGRTLCNTTSREWPRQYNGRLDLPFRDGAHIHHDAAHLNLPAFARCEDRVDALGADGDYAEQRKVGREHRRPWSST